METINNIETEEYNISNEEYFLDRKNVFKIREANEDLRIILRELDAAMDEIKSKRYTISRTLSRLDEAYGYKDMEVVSEVMKRHKAIKEFMESFTATKVGDFLEVSDGEEEEEFDVEEYFNKD